MHGHTDTHGLFTICKSLRRALENLEESVASAVSEVMLEELASKDDADA